MKITIINKAILALFFLITSCGVLKIPQEKIFVKYEVNKNIMVINLDYTSTSLFKEFVIKNDTDTMNVYLTLLDTTKAIYSLKFIHSCDKELNNFEFSSYTLVNDTLQVFNSLKPIILGFDSLSLNTGIKFNTVITKNDSLDFVIKSIKSTNSSLIFEYSLKVKENIINEDINNQIIKNDNHDEFEPKGKRKINKNDNFIKHFKKG